MKYLRNIISDDESFVRIMRLSSRIRELYGDNTLLYSSTGDPSFGSILTETGMLVGGYGDWPKDNFVINPSSNIEYVLK